jgi:hypothetical protein
MLALWIGLATAAAAPVNCPLPATPADIEGATRAGERAFAELDLPALRRAHAEALALVPCLTSPVPVPLAADFHRLMALWAFTNGDEALVLAEFHAARRLVPGYVVPEEVAPAGHPLQQLYTRSNGASEGTLQPTLPPTGGAVWVDGLRGAPRPDGISVLVQVEGADGRLLRSFPLAAGDPLPAFGPPPVDPRIATRRRVTLTATSATLLATAGTLWVAAAAAEDRFWDPSAAIPDRDLAAVRTRTNAFTVAAGTAATLGLGVGLVAGLTW